ncbi:hypothetical protein B4589_005995 [Halolamina sp. CBA1230]|uniref:hypothetical protein n=1 Tax=Halolamina sp. CBA1230 TaxID=1853690 RepID=UPI00117A4683|nr:hypothetical protein [Halolamina sp. CBA1230]QKY19956.1 hypothetical protein B4589_005995 [Halolamina sp. CBA1230]
MLCSLLLFTAPARAHGGPGISSGTVDAPTWLFLLTGVVVVAVSFLLTSFVTDRDLLASYHDRRLSIPGGATVRRWGTPVGAVVGVLGLASVVVTGVFGPPEADRNLAVLLVWVVWWAGFTASTYLLGNSWPALDPFGRLAAPLSGDGVISLPDWIGRWPAVAGLLLLVWLEVVTEVAADPTQLTVVVGTYLLATVLGSVLLGLGTWRRQIDPISGVFELYGRVAPIQRTDEGLELAAPGAVLTDVDADGTTVVSEVGFVIALLWVTTFDGFVTTPGWQSVAAPVIRAGLPAELAYFAAMLVGYALFFGLYWAASARVRPGGEAYRSAPRIAAAFAPTLLPIAAGYHFGHYVPYFVTQLPASIVVTLNPLSPPIAPPVLGLPGWIGWAGPVAVLLGHLLAVWAAHTRAFELFTGGRQPIRSQSPYVVVMVLYTITGLWLLAQPTIDVPFV